MEEGERTTERKEGECGKGEYKETLQEERRGNEDV